jgi:hypothetical protein
MLLAGLLSAQFNAPVAGGSYDLLATEILTGSQASVTFSSLSAYASTYQHLQLRIMASHTGAGGNAINMQLNGDTGSNYASHGLVGNGSSVSSYGIASNNRVENAVVLRQNLSNTSFGAGVIDILDPFEISKYTTVRALTGHASTESIVALTSSVRLNVESLTSLTLFPSANDIGANSRFSLYGLRSS